MTQLYVREFELAQAISYSMDLQVLFALHLTYILNIISESAC
jgi:hypothetical protein